MHKALLLIPAAMCLMAADCQGDVPDAKQKAADAGNAKAIQVLQHSGGQNAEQDNIASRLKLTMNPGQIGFIALFNQAGAPIAYYGVKGKVTSSGKRLTRPDETLYQDNIRAAASDEGTYGSSDPYVYFWTVDGQYVQWNGPYLYSDKPFRLRVEPLVIAIGEKA